jgi:hypothetical protein
MAGVAVGLIGTGLQGASYLKGKSDSKKEKREQRRLEKRMTAEDLRKLGKEQEQVLGSARSQIFSSGFTGYGSTSEAYLTELQTEQAKESAWVASVGAANANAISDRGAAMQRSYGYQAMSSLFEGVGKVGTAFNWGLDSDTNGRWDT